MKLIIKDFGRAFLLGLIIFLILRTVSFAYGYRVLLDNNLVEKFLINQLYSVVLYFVNATYIRYLFEKFGNKINSFSIVWRFVIGTLLVTLLSVFILNSVILMLKNGVSFTTSLTMQYITDYLGSLIITVIISVFFVAFFFYKTNQETKVKEQKVIAGRATAQFDALKNQLDPHFLFNSLNVLTSLIDEDPQGAQKFTTSLSKVYRYVLEQKNKELVTVAEEIQFAQTYISLLRMRFENSIVFNVSDELLHSEAKVVPLSLQLLLENAVKHNQVTPNKPLEISISAKNNYLVITNNLQPKSVLKHSSGVGLTNIKQRYYLLTSRSVEIEKNDRFFIVKIPILTKQITTMTTQESYLQDKRYNRAKEHVNNIKGFYGNLTLYLIIIPFLGWLNYRTTTFPWVIFPAMGWGLGLLVHAMEAFGFNPIFGKRWEERKIKEFMEKDI